MDHFTYDPVQDPREPAVYTKDSTAQEGGSDSDKDIMEDTTREAGAYAKEGVLQDEDRGDKDTIKDSKKKVNDRSAKLGRHRKEFDLVRRKRVLVFLWVGNKKPRHIWYSWASPIFEAVNSGFFKGDSSSRVWRDTLEAQRVHHELSWEKVARYSLALRAAQYGQSLDVTMDTDRMREGVKDRLLKCVYSNGTFPTHLDLTSKQPTTKWDDKYHCSQIFEIPLLLLQEESGCLDVAAFRADTAGTTHILPSIPMLPRDLTTLKESADRNTKATNGMKDIFDLDNEVVAKERAKMAKVVKRSARSTKVDRANVRDPPDFEPDWLFPYPDCFSSTMDTRTVVDIYKQAKEEADNLRRSIEYTEEPAYKVLGPGIDKFCSTELGLESICFECIPPWKLMIVDVGQASFRKTLAFNSPQYSDRPITLLSKRTWIGAKKRLTIVDACHPGQALLLYLGSAESEKLSIASFLSRHKMREDFTRDHAHKEVNMWTTELHLSFYKKMTVTSDLSRSMPALAESIFEGPEKLFAFPGKSKASLDKLQKGAIGWRFSGDLHDRRWTGTILAFEPGTGDENWISPRDLASDKGFHGQRKIIEARLFSMMTKTIHVSTRAILRDLNAVLGEGDRSIYRGSSDHHDPLSESFDQSYSRSKLYLELFDFLSHLDDNFKSTMETIEAYMDREKQRPVQPRWSIEDEAQCRPELQKWDREGKKNVALLGSVRNEINNKMSRVNRLRESLNADMQLRETRLQARSAEDVRLFTYLTIIFLPISFSSSLFSMSNAPDNSLVGIFAKVAVIALVITFTILFNPKTMSREMWMHINAGLHKLSDTMSTSSWDFWKKTHIDIVQAEKRNIQSDEPLEIRKMSKWWYCLFFLAFVLWELPAIRVLLAYDVFFPPSDKDSKQPRPLKKVLRVVLGLVSLPLFVFSFTFFFLIRNNFDLFRLFSSPNLGKQKDSEPTKTSNHSSKVLKEARVHNADDDNNKKGASKGREVEEANLTNDVAWEDKPVRVYKEKYNARVRRLTHPPILNQLELKALPPKEPRTARKKSGLESNDERGP